MYEEQFNDRRNNRRNNTQFSIFGSFHPSNLFYCVWCIIEMNSCNGSMNLKFKFVVLLTSDFKCYRKWSFAELKDKIRMQK